jgi:hypothetical protein
MSSEKVEALKARADKMQEVKSLLRILWEDCTGKSVRRMGNRMMNVREQYKPSNDSAQQIQTDYRYYC